jgi:hypothetical protein
MVINLNDPSSACPFPLPPAAHVGGHRPSKSPKTTYGQTTAYGQLGRSQSRDRPMIPASDNRLGSPLVLALSGSNPLPTVVAEDVVLDRVFQTLVGNFQNPQFCRENVRPVAVLGAGQWHRH